MANSEHCTLAQTVKQMKEVGRRLAESPAETGGLRSLQIGLRALLCTVTDSQSRFSWFFLCVFIDDIFYNLSGDIPYVAKADEVRSSFLQAYGGKLVELSAALDDRNHGRCCEVYAAMVGLYLNAVSEMNGLIR